MRKIEATVYVHLPIKDGETFEEANNRLFELLYNGLCKKADCDFEYECEEI